MIFYNGYMIETEPDYKKLVKERKVIDDILCTVYDENDVEHKHPLGDFVLVRGAGFSICSADEIEKAIMENVLEDTSAYEFVRKNNELDRMKYLLKKAINFVEDAVGLDASPIVMYDKIGITHKELADLENYNNSSTNNTSDFERYSNNMEIERLRNIISNAAEYIYEAVGHEETISVLKESVGMTDEDIDELLGESPSEIEDGIQMQ